MSDANITALATGMNTLHTALKNAFAATGTQCFLLKRTEQSATLVSVREVTTGFYFDRDESAFTFAPLTSDTTFHDHFTSAGFIAYGAAAPFQVFEILPEQKDETKHDASSPLYIAVVARTKERYTVPTP